MKVFNTIIGTWAGAFIVFLATIYFSSEAPRPAEPDDESLSAPRMPAVSFYSDVPSRDDLLETWFGALEQVETGGEKDPANVIGDKGRSRGWLQISRAYYIDSGYRKMPYEVACRDRYASREIVEGYMQRWVPKAWERLDFELMSHVHNRGSAGPVYWKKVRKALR